MCFCSLKQSIQNVQPLVNELEEIRAAKTEKDEICEAIEANRKELVRKEDRTEYVNVSLSILLSDPSVQHIMVYCCELVTGKGQSNTQTAGRSTF